jgi:hypothetical protein
MQFLMQRHKYTPWLTEFYNKPVCFKMAKNRQKSCKEVYSYAIGRPSAPYRKNRQMLLYISFERFFFTRNNAILMQFNIF